MAATTDYDFIEYADLAADDYFLIWDVSAAVPRVKRLKKSSFAAVLEAAAPVQSVAGRTGVITLSTSDITGFNAAVTTIAESIVSTQSPVTSVAGRSGDVELSNTDITGFNAAAAAAAPVQSVAGRTGAVTIAATDLADFDEAARDAAAAMFTNATHSGIAVAYDDANNTLALSNTSPGGTTVVTVTSDTDFKESVRAATTANITLSGEQTIDGVAVVAGDRVLVKNQNTGSANGLYDAAVGAWTRCTDADTDAEVTTGLMVSVDEGTTNGSKLFRLTTTGTITLGTTALSFSEVVIPSNPAVVKTVNSTTYTLQVVDANAWIRANNGSAITYTVPGNSTRIGINSVIWVQKVGAGNVTFSAGGGVTIRAPQGLVLTTQYAVAMLKKTASNEWTVTIIGQAASLSLTSADISDFTEAAQDAAASMVTAGTHVGLTATYTDGSNKIEFKVGFEIAVAIEAVMTNAEVLFRLVATRAFRVPSGATSSLAKAGVAATGSTTVSLKKNGVEFGTMVWAASGTSATITVSADTDFAVGDVMTWVGPATADATLAQIAASLVCSRT